MLVNGNNLTKMIVQIVEREEKLLEEINKINERFSTACNLKNKQEFIDIEIDGTKLQNRLNRHTIEKITVMTVLVSRNRNYIQN